MKLGVSRGETFCLSLVCRIVPSFIIRQMLYVQLLVIGRMVWSFLPFVFYHEGLCFRGTNEWNVLQALLECATDEDLDSFSFHRKHIFAGTAVTFMDKKSFSGASTLEDAVIHGLKWAVTANCWLLRACPLYRIPVFCEVHKNSNFFLDEAEVSLGKGALSNSFTILRQNCRCTISLHFFVNLVMFVILPRFVNLASIPYWCPVLTVWHCKIVL